MKVEAKDDKKVEKKQAISEKKVEKHDALKVDVVKVESKKSEVVKVNQV